ncbi:MAG: BrnT family toxin [Devosia sp.]
MFDPVKQASNKAKHGFDFADLTSEWFETAKIATVKLGRYRAIGLLAGVTVAVIFRPLGSEAVSVISMRRAGKSERNS